MSFFDEDPMSLPRDGQYYFNVLIRTIGIHPSCAEEVLGQDMIEIWFIKDIVEPRPTATFFFVDPTLEDDTEFEIECFPHCVVEVSQSLGVSWWDMLDFETDDPWRIDEGEDFYE